MNTSEFVLKRYLVHREYKNMNSKLFELGIQNGNLIKVERGKPHQDGVYEVNINQITIKGHKSPTSNGEVEDFVDDSVLFDKQFLFKILTSPEATALEFKHNILEKYN